MPLSDKEFTGKKTRKLVLLAVLVSLATALHSVELLFPNPFPVPGAKLGLANIITLITLEVFGWKEGLVVVVLRVFIGSLLGGTFLGLGFLLSFSGAVFSLLIMHFLFRYIPGLSVIGVSVGGAAAHNIAQVAAAAGLTQTTYLFYYLPFLLLISVPTGVFTGAAARAVLEKGIKHH